VLLTVYVFWGSTAPAMKIAVASLPPFWMAALRFTIAGAILWVWCRVRGVPQPTSAEWRGAAITGIVGLVLGNALFAWTLQYLPSGIDALVFALSPLWMAVFGFVLYRERLAFQALLGLGIGLAGMAFLYSPSGAQHLPGWPTALALGTSLAWGLASMMQRKYSDSDVVQMSALQMLVAAAVLYGLAVISGERLHAVDLTPSAVGALAYLIVFGSLAGFSAYVWLMNNVPTTLGSTYAYVNPLVALTIGIGVLHEPFSWPLAAGAAVILAGVALMVTAPKVGPAP